MKRYCFVLLFLLSVFVSSAQLTTFERAIKPQFYADFTKILSDTNGQWLVSGDYQDLFTASSPDYLTKLDSSGNTLWVDSSVDSGDIASISDLIKSSDGNYVLSGVSQACDLPFAGVFMKKVNPNGVLKWFRYFSVNVSVGGSWGLTNVIQLSDNGFLLSSQNIVYKTDTAGSLIWTDTLTSGSILCLLENQQQHYLVGTTSGITVLDSSGTLIGSHPFAGGAKEIIALQDTGHFVLSGTDFNNIDTAFSPILTLNLSGYLSSVQQIKYYGNNWWILGTENSLTTVLTLDSSLQYSNSFSFGDDHVFASDLDISSTHIALAGTETTGANRNMFVKTFLKSGISTIYNTDAGILNIRYDTSYSVHHIALPQGISDVYFDTYVTIKNFGTDILNDVFVNSTFTYYGICSHNYFMQQFTGLNLLPNDTVELHLGLLWDPDMYCLHTCTFDYCFWTSCPNGKVDKDHSNDSTCNGFTVDFLTGIQVQTIDETVSVFPNPVQSEISIQLSGEKNLQNTFEIKNMLGEKIFSGELHEKINKVDLSALSPGIYFINIQFDDKAVTRKIVKL